MLTRFFFELRAGGISASITEFLTLLEALDARVADGSAADFYYLARATLVKDERLYDRFDRIFGEHFKGADKLFERDLAQLPRAWLEARARLLLSEEERARIAALGGWEALLAALRERLREQRERHEGGNRQIGTAGTSAFGSMGFNPEGVRIGGSGAGARRGVQVWERREYANLDDGVELGTRNMKLALRRLRRFAREGVAEELDLGATIDATARNAGLLDLKLVPERRNTIKVLLLLDVGGSMEEHVRCCEELFSAARSAFKRLEHFYFHNCPYENLWRDNRRRFAQPIETARVLRTYGRDHRVIFVGDAAMSPYEILQPGGSIEHWNAEAGSVWLQRICAAFPRAVWLNPCAPESWQYSASTRIVRDLLLGRMFPLSLHGLDAAMAELGRRIPTQRPPIHAPH
jgi:uncharacterized protein with von Willebrand factor type A (vWA) domain